MEFFVIAEEELVIGFRFAGVKGIAVSSHDDALGAFRDATRSGIYGVLILSEEVSGMLEQEVVEWQMTGSYPLVVEIPGLQGHLAGKKSLIESIREAIGIRV